MKSNSDLAKKVLLGIALLGVMGLLGLATARAETPLSKDDVTLLLLGASPSDKIIQTVQERGIDFKMSPDLAKKFHDLGASDDLIEALQRGNRTPPRRQHRRARRALRLQLHRRLPKRSPWRQLRRRRRATPPWNRRSRKS